MTMQEAMEDFVRAVRHFGDCLLASILDAITNVVDGFTRWLNRS